jgi:hypothetical protein
MTQTMDKTYYEAVSKLEQTGTDREYIQGWIGGYMGNPKREEQRITAAYTAGYADGQNKTTENAAAWKARQ